VRAIAGGQYVPAAAPAALAKPSSGEFRSERQLLLEALTNAGGNKAEAARLLGVPRSTFFSRLKKYRIE
jgi:transcriptional regulator of acetoin/glycerol metabolism